MAIPTNDNLLIAWGSNFDQKVTASPVTYNLTAAQATAFHGAYMPFVAAASAEAVAKASGTRSTVLSTTTRTCKTNLLLLGRELYAIVQSARNVSPSDKQDVGVKVRKPPSPIPPPADAPGIAVVATVGNTVKVRLFDLTASARRGKPGGCAGAQIFTFAGPSPATDEAAWTFQGTTGKTRLDITFPSDIAPGARVWITARWFNNRQQTGPAATPVGTNIAGGSAMAA